MSYAQVVASGPAQSPEEPSTYPQLTDQITHPYSRAPPVPSIIPDEPEASSLIDVDSGHVNIVKSDFEEQEVKTDTQAARIERETEDKARAETKKAEQKADELKKKAAAKAKDAKAEIKKDAKKLEENKDNPVVVGNAILWTITAVAVGYGAYKKHSEGKLDLPLIATAAAGLGALATVDYFGSRWLLENKYPPK